MILVNGIAEDHIAATDRGLHYGDGVFRTMRLRGGRILHWPLHLEKLRSDCAALGIACCNGEVILRDINAIARTTPECVVKVMITRGNGLRGYAPPAQGAPTRIVIATSLPVVSHTNAGIVLHLCKLRLGYQPALAGVKHLNRLENVIARGEWDDVAISEGLLCDQEGNAICGTMTNLFIVEGGALVTPDLSRCGVAGVTRLRVMQLARKSSLRCTMENIPLERVNDADEIFLVNSVVGLWPVVRLEQRQWQPDAVTAKVRSWLEDDDAKAP